MWEHAVKREAIGKEFVPGIIKSQKELFLSLGKFKAGLSGMTGGSIMKANLQRTFREERGAR